MHDAADKISRQLTALVNQHDAPTFEVIVVDNNSTDGLVDVIAEWRRNCPLPIRLVRADAKAGVSYARNTGLRASKSELVLICDADDMVHEHWVKHMVGALESAELVGGAIDVRTLNDGPESQWRPTPSADRLPVSLDFLPYAQGCNIGVRREVAIDVGGWDENFSKGGDDVDFSWRVQLAGHRIAFVPSAVVAYEYRKGIGSTIRQGFFYSANDYHLLNKFVGQGLRRRSALRLGRTVCSDVMKLPLELSTHRTLGSILYRLAIDVGAFAGQARYDCQLFRSRISAPLSRRSR